MFIIFEILSIISIFGLLSPLIYELVYMKYQNRLLHIVNYTRPQNYTNGKYKKARKKLDKLYKYYNIFIKIAIASFIYLFVSGFIFITIILIR